MKGISRDELMAMPAGTVYCEFVHGIVGESMIKWDTMQDEGKNTDWYYSSLVDFDTNDDVERSEVMEKVLAGASTPMDPAVISRDGMFDDEKRYVVFEKDDIDKAIAVFNKANGYNKKAVDPITIQQLSAASQSLISINGVDPQSLVDKEGIGSGNYKMVMEAAMANVFLIRKGLGDEYGLFRGQGLEMVRKLSEESKNASNQSPSTGS